MNERRYTEEEVEKIFERAAAAQQAAGRRQLPPGEGMTLSELRSIGSEVGLPAELVEQAALSLDQGAESTRRFIGLPLGVGRTVELGRRMTEAEWEQLVVDLRDTFDARGSIRTDGSLRQWTNGNLQALLEPTATGHRLRLRSLLGVARAYMTMGLGMIGITAATIIGGVATGAAFDPAAIVPLGAIGVALFGVGAGRVPGWAARRRRQFEAIAARLALASPEKALEPRSESALPDS